MSEQQAFDPIDSNPTEWQLDYIVSPGLTVRLVDGAREYWLIEARVGGRVVATREAEPWLTRDQVIAYVREHMPAQTLAWIG